MIMCSIKNTIKQKTRYFIRVLWDNGVYREYSIADTSYENLLSMIKEGRDVITSTIILSDNNGVITVLKMGKASYFSIGKTSENPLNDEDHYDNPLN